jgi:coenzyme F420-0:L-glutamate ligase / coenzyme F420-1:gamma-L-glutamate ligase
MDVLDVIKKRRSMRVFDRRMPPRGLIAECLEAATWAPSATNQQPWEFIVLTGEALEAVNAINEEKFFECMQSDAFGNPPGPLKARQQEVLDAMIAAAEKAGIDPNEIFEKSLRFFDAPVAVYFVSYKGADNQYLLSTAAALENFLLAAHARGLGACWLTVTVVCAEDIKKHLSIPEDRELLGGVALGYPVEGAKLNAFERKRAPVDEVTKWLGF